jgi:hypothetical protein
VTTYSDRSLAVTPHAVERLRERARDYASSDDVVRELIARPVQRAFREGAVERHTHEGQFRVPFQTLGTELVAIVGPDETGWSTSGRAVLTVLTPAQVARGPSGRVVHCKRAPYDVYIGRGSRWGNPYRIGPDGTRAEVTAKFEEYLYTRLDLLQDLHDLKDKVLGCFCAPQRCHGDVLAQLANDREEGT